MDLRLYMRVLWRFRLLVAVGMLLGLVLAVLAQVRVSPDGIEYRDPELFSSTTRLGVTQNGFPWGRLFAQEPSETEGDEARGDRKDIPVADPNRFNTLAVLYAELATSDPIRQLMRREGLVRGKILATPLVSGEFRTMLPMIDILAISDSPAGAVLLAQRSATALQTYLQEQQRSHGVPAEDRVVLEQLTRPRPPQIFQPRSMTMPIVIFLAVLFVTIALAFLLENVRPRERDLGGEPAERLQGLVRRSA